MHRKDEKKSSHSVSAIELARPMIRNEILVYRRHYYSSEQHSYDLIASRLDHISSFEWKASCMNFAESSHSITTPLGGIVPDAGNK